MLTKHGRSLTTISVRFGVGGRLAVTWRHIINLLPGPCHMNKVPVVLRQSLSKMFCTMEKIMKQKRAYLRNIMLDADQAWPLADDDLSEIRRRWQACGYLATYH